MDFVVYVLACAPELFPEEDWLRPEEQMNLERAFVGLRLGLKVVVQAEADPAMLMRCGGLVEEAYAQYRASQDHNGQRKLEELEGLLRSIAPAQAAPAFYPTPACSFRGHRMDDPVFLPDDAPKKPITDRQTYNIVTDTVVGPNIRLKDNLFQGLAIFVCLVLGAAIGALVTADHVPGALAGGFIGIVVGLFGSGIFLMIYRAAKHARGKHD